MKPFQISAQMKGGPAHTCALTHTLRHLPNTLIPTTQTHSHSHTHTPRSVAALCVCRFVDVSECLSSLCFWAWCQHNVLRSSAAAAAHHPHSQSYPLGKRVVQREDKDKCVSFHTNTYRFSVGTRVCADAVN